MCACAPRGSVFRFCFFQVTRALLSVSDKAGLLELATALVEMGVELLSTGGTAAKIREAGLPVMDVSEYTGFPEMMDGRVKTLHPKVHGGIMHVRGNAAHEASLAEAGMKPIDLVVLNLYAFEVQIYISTAARAPSDTLRNDARPRRQPAHLTIHHLSDRTAARSNPPRCARCHSPLECVEWRCVGSARRREHRTVARRGSKLSDDEARKPDGGGGLKPRLPATTHAEIIYFCDVAILEETNEPPSSR